MQSVICNPQLIQQGKQIITMISLKKNKQKKQKNKLKIIPVFWSK